MGLCAAGPLVLMEPAEIRYGHVHEGDAKELVGSLGQEPVARLDPHLGGYFDGQTHVVLENSGHIDPEKIDEYIARGGYEGLVKALTDMNPTSVIEQISKSGLRGRGGGGYPTGLKWDTVAKVKGTQKYVICNGDEGDPGAFMDRSVLESDPQRVIEGMAIAAYAMGATKGFIYVRAEYPLAVQRLTVALREARRRGFLGNAICETTFNFDIDIRLGAGAFVCGEETALIASIEGQARDAAATAAVSGGIGTVGRSDADQQRGDIRQRGADHPAWRGVVFVDGNGEKQGHEGFRADGKDSADGPDGSADGDDAAADYFRHRRRRSGRQGNSRQCRLADPRADVCRRSTSICRSVTTL